MSAQAMLHHSVASSLHTNHSIFELLAIKKSTWCQHHAVCDDQLTTACHWLLSVFATVNYEYYILMYMPSVSKEDVHV